MDLNVFTITGRLGRDPETRSSSGGTAVGTLSVAVGGREKSRDGQWEDTTTWVPVTTFGATAENAARHLRKGSRVAVSGHLRVRAWEDKDTGAKRQAFELVASSVVYLDTRESSGGGDRGREGGGGGYGGRGGGGRDGGGRGGGGYSGGGGGGYSGGGGGGYSGGGGADDDIPF